MVNTQRIRHAVSEAALTVLAVAGAVCILLVGLAFFFNISLIMFKTGSMSPTIPAGSVAIVREIPASEITIGDVVTVDRGDVLPVTHRVTTIAQGPSTAERVITMRGDANETDDVAPYTVTTVRIVMGSVPALAHVIVWFSHPLVLGAITVSAASLVTWAFWPKGPSTPRTRRRTRGGRHGVRFAGSSAVLAVALAVTPAHSAQAGEQVIQGQYLTLTSITDPGMAAMAPGTTAHWQVGVASAPPSTGVVRMALRGTGSTGLALTAEVRACSVRWVAATCPGQQWPVLQPAPLAIDGIERELLTMPTSEQRWFLFAITMSPSAQPAPGAVVTQVLHVSASEESLVVGLGQIASTGVDTRAPMHLALVAVAAGLALAFTARWITSMRRRS